MNKIIKSYLAIMVIIVVTVLAGCKKKEEVPIISTTAISNITATTASGGGNITNEGSSTVTSRGVCWSTSTTPTISNSKTTDGAGAGSFSSNLTGLNGATSYFVRAYATNTAGIGYGMVMSFTTLGQAPTPTVASATNINTTSATLNGSVNANYLSTVVTFEYGTTSSYSSTITAAQSPVTGNTSTSVSANITGLTAGTTYHFRVKATNSLGTSYGSDMSFTTDVISVTDADGNMYQVIRIGTQLWMAENLKTTKYNDNTAIPNITDNTTWAALTTGAYSDYNNTPSNSTIYGRLYNWYAVDNNAGTKVASNGGKNVCPTSWHVPTDSEWSTLTDYLVQNGYGYGGIASEIAKSMASTYGWTTWGTLGTVGNDQGSNNSSGFTALPSGSRGNGGAFSLLGSDGTWWSSSGYSTTNAYFLGMSNASVGVGSTNGSKGIGLSVRCLRDF
ncbi:MAG: FISUMP domain-containing protein [Bacteroidales bacterium]|jgi:uncharacterized protein (TIGR02145 family)